MNNINATIGTTYTHGNLYRPQFSRVIGFVAWEDLPSKQRERAPAYIPHGHPAMLDGAEWVKHNHKGRGVQYSPRDVFEATRYLTHEDMVATYSRSGS